MQGSVHPQLSIIVPVLNEASQLPELAAHLLPLQDTVCEVILVDGGSEDGTVSLATELGFEVISANRGRASQMNKGADYASGNVLLFLHADTRLPENAVTLVLSVCQKNNTVWGRFDVQITGDSFMFKVIARLINWRSRLTAIATGDQAIFVVRRLFNKVKGFPEQALMEDIELCKRLKIHARPICLRESVITSGRRWQERGIWRTIWLMWHLRLAYWCGANPDDLLVKYR